MMSVPEKEILVLNNLYRKPSISQRGLAKATTVSLGLINAILHKFLESGYLEISRVNKRQLQYRLTAKGIAEAIRLSHKNLLNTIQNYNSLKENLVQLLKRLQASGHNYFSIHGDGALRELIESIFSVCFVGQPIQIGQEHRVDPTSVVLNVTDTCLEGGFEGNVVNVFEEMSFSR